MAVTAAGRPIRSRWWTARLAWALAMAGYAALLWVDHLLREAARPKMAMSASWLAQALHSSCGSAVA
jgi:hypothetical protein